MRMLIGLLLFSLFLAVEVATASPVNLGGALKPNEKFPNRMPIAIDYDSHKPEAAIWSVESGIVAGVRDGRIIRGSTFDKEMKMEVRYVVDLNPTINAGIASTRNENSIYSAKCDGIGNAMVLINRNQSITAHCVTLK